MIEGEIVLASLPQTDGNTKLRPVLLLKELPGFKDFLACGIPTQLRHQIIGFDEIVSQNAPGFDQTGLRESSLIRLGFLAVIPSHKVAGKIGSIQLVLHKALLRRLAEQLLQ